MNDNNNIELVEGDLCILTINNPIDNPTEIIIFLEVEPYTYKVLEDGTEVTKITDRVKYYPLTDLGLEVANFDANISQPNFHRQQKFTATHICSKNLTKIDSSFLTGYKKTLYDNITALL